MLGLDSIKQIFVSANKKRKEVFSPNYRQEQIDVVTSTVVGKSVKTLAIEAGDILAEEVGQAEKQVTAKQAELERVQAQLEVAEVRKEMATDNFDTVMQVARK